MTDMRKVLPAVCGMFLVVAGCGGSSGGGSGGTGGQHTGGTGGQHTGGTAGQGTGGTVGAGGQHSGGNGGTGTGGAAGTGTGGAAGTGTGGAAGQGTGGAAGTGTGGAANADGGLPGDGGTKTYSVGGTVSGLTGSGLTLLDGAGHQLAITANGGFTFPTALAAGQSVMVSISHQPAMPTQTCAVTGGTIADLTANVTNVAIACTTNRYTVGGTVAGLVGTGLVLQDNSGDDLPVTGNGGFTFATSVASGATYTVSVKTQPSAPAQTCQVSGGSGTVGGANVTSVSVNCAINRYAIGGTVSGLVGTGLVLEDNAGDDLSVTGNGTFAFATAVASGGTFAVTVKSQPTSPMQVCSVSQGTGTVATTNVTSVAVVCATDTYAVSGMLNGLVGSGLVLQDNLGDNLSLSTSGTFAFTTPVADGAAYGVTVLTQPSSPSQTCTVTNGSGTIAGGAISNVAISCVTNSYLVGGNVVGLTGSGLTLQNGGGDDLAITLNGGFAFATPVASGGAFAVTISHQPTNPVQTCTVSGGSGAVGGGDVNSVTINCATDQFTIGGTVTNLSGGGLTLSLNAGATTLQVGNDGSFSFPTTIPSGAAYAVTVASQPAAPSQTCTVTSGSGTVVDADISNITVDCTVNSYAIGGTVSGVLGMGLTLQDNNGNDLAVTTDGTFVFSADVASGQGYSVTVSAQPTNPWQTCTVSNGSGGVTSADINNVSITCSINSYQVGGTISGLASSVTLNDNGGDALIVSSNGTFVFPTSVASGAAYAVTITSQPNNPAQTCAVTGDSGTITGGAITGVTVTCTTNTYAIGGTASGLSGTGLTLQDNGGDDLIVNANGSFAFPTKVASGATYTVTIKTQPSSPTQTCSLGGATGTVGAADVSSVTVNCAINSYIVGGTVTGLTGTGLVIQENGGGDLAISGSGSFAFAAPIASGQPFAVTVKTQPTSPWQTCTVTGGSGTITNANISAQITCTANPYSVAVNVTNLAGTGLILQDNAGDNLSITANGVSTFATPVRSGMTYAVTVLSQPINLYQTCTVTAPAGTIAGAGVTLAVNCAKNVYTVGGTVSGLTGMGLVLQDNAGDNLTVSANGTFTFPTSVASGNAYAVTVLTPPSSPAQSCVVTNGSGTITGIAVSNVTVACTNVVICSTAAENGNIMLSCPTGQKITALDFASYGTPNGSCGAFTTSSCNATTSTMDVTTSCVGLNSCTVAASNGVFGDPCVGTVKRLYVEARCQ
jgi:large repetitive protein